MLSTRNLIIMALVLTVGAVISFKLFPDSAKGNTNMAEAASDFGLDQEKQVTSDAQQSTDNHIIDKNNQKSASKAVDEPDVQINKVADAKSFIDFKDWLDNFDEDDLDAGIKLATVRKAELVLLLKTNPERAYKESISFSDYEKLPKAVAALVEKPFSRQVDYSVIYADAAPGSPDAQSSQHGGPITSLRFTDEKIRYSAYTFGSRNNISSKKGIAAQGFTLDGDALLADEPMLVLTGDDLIYAKANFVDKRSKDTDAYTGEAIATEPVVGVAGGELFYFASEENVSLLNDDLKKLESRLGPDSGSQVLFSASAGSNDGSSTNTSTSLPLQTSASVLLASADPWTTTKKKVFFIRVAFPDKPEESVSKSELNSLLNQSVSLQIKNMSRGKTWIEAEVSNEVVMLPEKSSFYTPEGLYHKMEELRDDAMEAYSSPGTGFDLSMFDIVGVHFVDIGMGVLEDDGSYFEFGGYAGGDAQWLQGRFDSSLVVHEFGHNYGVGHAGSWITDNGNAISEQGYREEYGDMYDIMGSGGAPQGYFNPQFLSKLEWVSEHDWQNVTASGLYRIYSFDHPDASGLQGLKVDRGDGSFYWLGYRQQYQSNEYYNVSSGAYILWQRNASLWESLLIDTTPDSNEGEYADLYDSAISLGRTYSDSLSGLHITALQKGSDSGREWLDIQVNFDDGKTNTPPSVEVYGPLNALTEDPTVFTAKATDSEDSFLSYAWDFGDGELQNSASSTSHIWNAAGEYDVSVAVSDMKGNVVTSGSIKVTVTAKARPYTGSWSLKDSAVSGHLKRVATNGSAILAVGDYGVTSYSTNWGQSWTSATSWKLEDGTVLAPWGVRIIDVASLGSVWSIIAREYDSTISSYVGTIYTSSDGLNWVQRYKSGESSYNVFTDIAVGNGVFVVSSRDNALYSSDGKNWNTSDIIGIESGSYIEKVAYGNNIFLAVTADSKILKSTDGSKWEVLETSISDFWSINGFTYTDGRFILHDFNTLYSSEDNGATFDRIGKFESYGFTFKGSKNGVNIAMDSNGKLYQATNFTDWLLIEDFDNILDAIVLGNRFFAVGSNGAIYQSQIAKIIDNAITNIDQDSDGHIDHLDNCPARSNSNQADRDGDGLGNPCDDDIDGDTILNIFDALPWDKTESKDFDGDGIGDNKDTDDDNDGVADTSDPFPNDDTEWADTDLDGVGNNTDTDDDGDGLPDTWEITNGLDPLDASDQRADLDNDKLDNLEEYLAGTDPKNADSDSNGISDGQQFWPSVGVRDPYSRTLLHAARSGNTV